MTQKLSLSILCLLIFIPTDARADTFEFLTYTPPSGWTQRPVADGTTYQRNSGVGLIYFYNSFLTPDSPMSAFSKMWRARVAPTLPGTAPTPRVGREGDYSIALGTHSVNAQGTPTTFALVTIVGQGRAIGVLTMAAGDDVLKEITAFLDSVKISQAGTTGGSTVDTIDIDYQVPPGYVAQRDGRAVVLKPAAFNEQSPCVYGISPSRASSGDLERDARAALLEPLPGWQVKGDRHNAMRGKGTDGWPYFWFRTDVQLPGTTYQYLSAMSMAVTTGTGRVGIVWGFGDPAKCTLDDVSFARLFLSLRPRGWTPDGGRALERDLVGTWRNSLSVGIAQYKFTTDNYYEYGLGTITRMGIFETTASSALDGRYDLTGATLTMTPNVRGRGSLRYKVRIYDEYVAGRWTRALSLLSEERPRAIDVQYLNVQ